MEARTYWTNSQNRSDLSESSERRQMLGQIGELSRSIGMTQRFCGRRARAEHRRLSQYAAKKDRQLFGVQAILTDNPRRTSLFKYRRVGGLMIVHGKGIRNED